MQSQILTFHTLNIREPLRAKAASRRLFLATGVGRILSTTSINGWLRAATPGRVLWVLSTTPGLFHLGRDVHIGPDLPLAPLLLNLHGSFKPVTATMTEGCYSM